MDNDADTNDAAAITLGGKMWQVPVLTARQNKVIDPLILGLLPIFSEWQHDKAAALSRLGSEQYDSLLEIAFVAIRRAHPDLTHEKFLDLPVTLPELITAFSAIAQQTGVFQKAPAEAVAPGEAAGE